MGLEDYPEQRKKNKQKSAAKKLIQLCIRTKYKCHWCTRPIIPRREINEERFIEETADYVGWLQGTTILRHLKATVDHVIPLCEGGTSHLDNLVAACGPCNRDRTNKPDSFARKLPHRRREAAILNTETRPTVAGGLPGSKRQQPFFMRNRGLRKHATATPYSRKNQGLSPEVSENL